MVAMKYIIPHTSPLFLAAFRLLPAGILTLILAAILKLPQPKTWKAWLWIGLFALVDGAMFQGLLTTGLVNTGAGLGAVLIDAQPLVVALLARLLFGNLIGLWGWLGLAIGIAGISLCGLPAAWIYSVLENGIPLASWSQNLGEGGVDWHRLLHSADAVVGPVDVGGHHHRRLRQTPCGPNCGHRLAHDLGGHPPGGDVRGVGNPPGV